MKSLVERQRLKARREYNQKQVSDFPTLSWEREKVHLCESCGAKPRQEERFSKALEDESSVGKEYWRKNFEWTDSGTIVMD